MNAKVILQIVDEYEKGLIGLASASLQLIIEGCEVQEVSKLLNIPENKVIVKIVQPEPKKDFPFCEDYQDE